MTEPVQEKLEAIIAQNCAAARLRLINRVVTNIYDEKLRSAGIRVNQLTMLIFITYRKSVTQKDIQDILHMEKSTVSRNVERMRNKGWIEAAKEGKTYRLTVTPLGQKLIEESFPLWQKAQEQVYHLLGKDNVDNIKAVADFIWSHSFR